MFNKNLLTLLIFFVSSAVLAQFYAGLPVVASSSSSSGGASTWFDAGFADSGVNYDYLSRPIAQQYTNFQTIQPQWDGGWYQISDPKGFGGLWVGTHGENLTGGGSIIDRVQPTLVIFNETAPAYASPSLEFRARKGAVAMDLGYIFGATYVGNSGHYETNSGLNIMGASGTGNIWFANNTTGAATYPVAFGHFDGSSKGFVAKTPSGYNAWGNSVDGSRIDVGSAADDYWYSNGTNIKTPSAVTVGSFTTAGLPAAATVGAGTLAYDTTLSRPSFSTGAAWVSLAAISTNPGIITSVYVNAATTAATTYSLEPGPPAAFQVDAIRFTISTAGAGGTTNANFRASDGTNNCDCALACNSTGTTGYRIACTGTCASFAANAGMTYSFTSIGDCVTGPTVLGNITVEGKFR